jgi:hypothetical protein
MHERHFMIHRGLLAARGDYSAARARVARRGQHRDGHGYRRQQSGGNH